MHWDEITDLIHEHGMGDECFECPYMVNRACTCDDVDECARFADGVSVGSIDIKELDL